MNFSAIRKKLRAGTLLRIISVIVVLVLFGTTLYSSNINSNADTLMPGTQAYYDQKFEEAKVQAGWKKAGSYTNNATGGTINVSNQGPWMLDLNTAACSNPWNGSTAGSATGMTGTGTTGNPYQVTTAEQLRYCIVNQKSFRLMKDIDLGGYVGRNWTTPSVSSTAAWVADGNGYTVWNLYSSEAITQQSMFGQVSNLTIKDFRLSNNYMYGYGNSSTLRGTALFAAKTENLKIQNCAAENSVVHKNSNAIVAAVFVADGIDAVIDNSYANNCHVSLFNNDPAGTNSCCAIFACSAIITITNSFAINGTVIGNIGHNGAFISCTNSATIKNCFSDIEVYGNKDAGAFMGTIHHGTTTIENCFSTGKVEGTDSLGGLIGAPDNSVWESGVINLTINQSYSAAMVGMMSEAKNQGSMLGSYKSASHSYVYNPNVLNIAFNNCYGAGEVGSLGVNAAAGRGTDSNTTGGFMGEHDGKVTYSYCYYDKQTTAMKEWAIGNTQASGTYLGGYTSAQCRSLGSGFDVKGVLTTDAVKGGVTVTGLTSAPGSNGAGSNAVGTQSFTGFASTSNSQWTFEEGCYPQLKVFTNPTTFTNSNWMTTTELHNLVKAYSRASVSTAKLETWDKDYAGNPLSASTYDTVRDLTLKFYLSSDNATAWEKDDVTVDIWGDTVDVLHLGKSGSNEWYCEDFTPGIEWLTVNYKIGNQIGKRRLRIIPTAALDAGTGKTITRGNTYDHADDVRLAYSTGRRLNTNSADISIGVFPDSPLNAYQQAAQPALTGTVLANFNAANDYYKNVYAGHLTKAGTSDNSTNGSMNVYIYKDAVIDPATGKVTIGDSVGVDNNKNSGANAINNQKFNGYEAFSETTDTRYFIDYVWSLQDGRYMQNGKTLYVKGSPYKVRMEAVNPAGEPESKGLYLSASDPSGPNFGTVTRSSDQIERTAGVHAKTSWKPASKKVIVTKLTLQTTYDDEGNWGTPVTIENPSAGDELTVARLYQRKVTLDNGSYYTEPVIVNKTYTVKLDSSGYYYLEFTKADTVSGIHLNDVEDDIKVTLTVDYLRTDLEIHKYLESAAEEEETFTFQISYQGDGEQTGAVQQTMYAVVTIPAGKTEGKATFKGVDIGWYAVTEMDSNWRFEQVNSKLAEDNPDAEIIDEESGTVIRFVEEQETGSYKFCNKRLDIPWINGKSRITNEMPSADQY